MTQSPKSQDIVFSNPDGVPPPAGAYSHGVLVPPGASTLFIAGQIGLRSDGTLGATIGEQAEQVFQNIVGILRGHGMEPGDIVKLTTFVVAGQPAADVGVARRQHLGSHRPAATLVYVSQLYAPEWFVEVEAIAAKV
jgi:enamine deaminase RidA (YjgF/YER057c/UK114 family)